MGTYQSVPPFVKRPTRIVKRLASDPRQDIPEGKGQRMGQHDPDADHSPHWSNDREERKHVLPAQSKSCQCAKIDIPLPRLGFSEALPFFPTTYPTTLTLTDEGSEPCVWWKSSCYVIEKSQKTYLLPTITDLFHPPSKSQSVYRQAKSASGWCTSYCNLSAQLQIRLLWASLRRCCKRAMAPTDHKGETRSPSNTLATSMTSRRPRTTAEESSELACLPLI